MRQNGSDIPAMVSQAWMYSSTTALPADNTGGPEKCDDTTVESGSDNGQRMNGEFNGPKMITFDGDQTLYSDGSNFDSNPNLASYLCQLLSHGVIVAVVTAAGYEYNVEKYEFRLSGLLNYFKAKKLTAEQCERFLLFGGECNYLLAVSFWAAINSLFLR
jgi:IMP-specific 5'-nucleotidase